MSDKKSHNYFDNLFDKQIDMKFDSCFGMQPHIISGNCCINLHKLHYSLNSMILDKLCHKLFDIRIDKLFDILLHNLHYSLNSMMFDNIVHMLLDNIVDRKIGSYFHKQTDNFGLQFGNMTDKVTDI